MQTARDTVLMLHGLRVMSDYKDAAERATFYASIAQIPELKSEDLDDLDAKVSEIRAKYPDARASIAALRDMSSETIKKKTFLVAIDVAMANGHVDAIEDDLLEDMREALGLDLDLAEKIIEVLGIKYAT
jgi:tellurite resistance protein